MSRLFAAGYLLLPCRSYAAELSQQTSQSTLLSHPMSVHRTTTSTAFVADLFRLDGRVALVTGASNGIGRRMAETLARAGAAVLLVARRPVELAEVKAGIEALGGCASCLPADLSDISGIAELAKVAITPFGTPDILVNAAGINPRAPADTCTPSNGSRPSRSICRCRSFWRKRWCRVCARGGLATSSISPHCRRGGRSAMALPMVHRKAGSAS